MMRKDLSPRLLALAAGLALAVVLAGSSFFYRTQQQHARQDIEKQLQSIAQLKIEQIVAWRTERLGDASVLTESTFFSEGVARWLATPTAEITGKILARFRALQRYNQYSDITLLDATGQARLSSSGQVRLIHEEERSALALALRERRPVMVDLHTGHGDEAVYLDVVAPLFAGNGAAAQPLGAVVLQADARQVFYHLIQSWPTPSRTAETVLIRRAGEEALYLNKLRHQKSMELKLRIPLSRMEVPAVMAVLGRKGVVEGTDYRGVKSVAFLSAIPDSPWFLITKMDAEEAFAPWRMQAGFILGLMFLFLAVLLTATGVVWQVNEKVRTQQQAAETLRASETMLNETGRMAKIGGWAIDLEKGTLTWTREVYAIHEVEDGFQPTVEAAINFYAPEWRPVIQLAVKRAIEEGLPFNIDLEVITAKNRRIWVHAMGHALEVDGRVRTVSGTFQDITMRKRAEAAVLQERGRAEQYLNIAEVILVAFDDQARITLLNRKGYEVLGYSEGELLGKDWFRVCLPPEEYETVFGVYLKIIAGEIKPFEYYENHVLTKSGTKRYIAWHNTPLKDQTGHIIGTLSSGEDITERRRAEAEIRQLNEELEQRVKARTAQLETAHAELDRYFTMSLDMLCIAGFDGYFKRLNPSWERVLGWTTEELCAQPFLSFVHPDDQAATVAAASRLAGGKDVISFENRYRCKDGSYRWIIWQSTSSASVGLIYAVAHDLTTRKQAEEKLAAANLQLEVANKELEAFSYSVSHDLRAPLRAVDGFSHVLLEDYEKVLNSEGKDYLKRIRTAATRMGQLIDDMLTLSRISRAVIHKQPVDVTALARSVLTELQEAEPQRKVEVQVADKLQAEADPNLLRIVLENLLGNAWKFTSKTPQTKIEFGQVEGARHPSPVTFFVRDNGAGFDKTYADKLFGAFQRLHRQDEFPGTGVGLATVARIIHRHGGEVWAEGAMAQGATFFFTLEPRV